MPDPRLWWRWLPIVAAVIATLVAWTRFLDHVEARAGVVLPDPLLDRFAAIDLTWPIFTLVYGGLAVGLVLLLRSPRHLAVGLLSYAVMVALRIACMWAAPLDPPPGMILLVDPIVGAAGVAHTPTRDLFFSGHTATLCIIGFASPGARMRLAYFVLAATMGAMVLLQHVHYTVDVLVAPMAAYAAHRIALRVLGSAQYGQGYAPRSSTAAATGSRTSAGS